MAVKTYIPQFTVIVFKAITRSDNGQPTRLQGGQSQSWSITEHLGDGSEISVSKSVTSPKGSFVITVPDRYYKIAPADGGNTPAGMDTLYGLLEPMDEIEIRLVLQPNAAAAAVEDAVRANLGWWAEKAGGQLGQITFTRTPPAR